MKVIVIGATGFVGSEVLKQLLRRSDVGQVTCLTRRLTGVQDAKLVELEHKDFTSYSERLLVSLANHAACIWTLGGKVSDLGSGDEFEKITHTFTLSFARGMAAHAADRFSFCYLSGMGADPSESSRWKWEQATRYLKGRTEKDLLALGAANANFTAYCFRPGGILPIGTNPLARAALAPLSIGVDVLAKAMIVAATANKGHSKTIPNGEIKQIARTGKVG